MTGPVSGTEGTDPAPVAPAPAPAATETSVTIVAPFQTSHAGQVYGPGDLAVVPAETAACWVTNRWAVPAE